MVCHIYYNYSDLNHTTMSRMPCRLYDDVIEYKESHNTIYGGELGILLVRSHAYVDDMYMMYDMNNIGIHISYYMKQILVIYLDIMYV